MKYRVLITETLQKEFEVDASSKDEALDIIKQKYKNEEIILTANDYIQTDYAVKNKTKHIDSRER